MPHAQPSRRFPLAVAGRDPVSTDIYSNWLLAGAAGLLAQIAAAQLFADHVPSSPATPSLVTGWPGKTQPRDCA
jgi:hypothetical protein